MADSDKKNEKGELEELKHDAWPGYPKAFYITFIVLTIYLLFIFLKDKLHLAGGH